VNLALVAGLVTGSDNLFVGAAVGLLPLSLSRRVSFALAFAVAEASMTLAGYAFAIRDPGGDLPPTLMLAAAGVLVLLTCWRSVDLARLTGSPAAIVLLPLSLSLDNLAAGAGLAVSGLPTALGAGLISATLTAAAPFAAWPLARAAPRVVAPLAGLTLLALAAPRLVEALS
jgi:manganese efflux pump family protein